jgi:hypothetical protein
MEVNSETRGRGEGVEDPFQVDDMLGNGPDDDEGIISILEDGTGEIIDKRVKEESLPGGLEEHLLKDIYNDVEEERGQGVSLAEPSTTLNPPSGNSVKEDGCVAREIEIFNPGAPKVRKPLGRKDPVEGVPTNRVKGLAEIKFENCRGSRSAVAGLDNVRSIHKIFGNGPPRDEAGLVGVDKIGDQVAEVKG